jgi:hypothetical protein
MLNNEYLLGLTKLQPIATFSNENVMRIMASELLHLRALVATKDDALVSYSEFYEKVQDILGYKGMLPSSEMDDRMLSEIARMREEVEKLKTSLWKITEWTKAYPLETWPEPTKEEWANVHAILKDHGIYMDKFNVSNLRHVVNGIAKIIAEATDASTD